MKIKIITTLAFLTICMIIFSCAELKLYGTNKEQSGVYELAKVDSIRNYLFNASGSVVKDTIIIKYDFNNDDCWNMLDQQSNEYISNVVNGMNLYIAAYQNAHPKSSVYQFREKGKNFNKLKLRNKNIIIDNGFLRKNIFNTLATCGTSLKLYPDGHYQFIYSDSHFAALQPVKK